MSATRKPGSADEGERLQQGYIIATDVDDRIDELSGRVDKHGGASRGEHVGRLGWHRLAGRGLGVLVGYV